MPAISNHEALTTGCCIAGGGPAGMMLGFLLARVGVEVVVLEKHPDFLRDFRGDTIHPSTLEVIRELGLLDEFLKLPHEKARRLSGVIGDELVQLADFTYLRTRCRFALSWKTISWASSSLRRSNLFRQLAITWSM